MSEDGIRKRVPSRQERILIFFEHICGMWNKLKAKWKVKDLQLVLILFTFALGGSSCGYLARWTLSFLSIENQFVKAPVYILLLTAYWPICVLAISIPMGQFAFFRNYLLRVFKWFGKKRASQEKKRLAIFASGTGSNAEVIANYFKGHPGVEIALIVSNNPQAGVLQMAGRKNIPTLLLEKNRFTKGDAYVQPLRDAAIDLIVLAGFLWKIPVPLIQSFPGKIVNIHPALLPKYGGKGMYGLHVHEAVIAHKETESGITIHVVDELYDHGPILFQEKCPVAPADTPALLQQKVQALEHRHFAPVIERMLSSH